MIWSQWRKDYLRLKDGNFPRCIEMLMNYHVDEVKFLLDYTEEFGSGLSVECRMAGREVLNAVLFLLDHIPQYEEKFTKLSMCDLETAGNMILDIYELFMDRCIVTEEELEGLVNRVKAHEALKNRIINTLLRGVKYDADYFCSTRANAFRLYTRLSDVEEPEL